MLIHQELWLQSGLVSFFDFAKRNFLVEFCDFDSVQKFIIKIYNLRVVALA